MITAIGYVTVFVLAALVFGCLFYGTLGGIAANRTFSRKQFDDQRLVLLGDLDEFKRSDTELYNAVYNIRKKLESLEAAPKPVRKPKRKR